MWRKNDRPVDAKSGPIARANAPKHRNTPIVTPLTSSVARFDMHDVMHGTTKLDAEISNYDTSSAIVHLINEIK